MWRVQFNDYVQQHPSMGQWYVRAQRSRFPLMAALAAGFIIVVVPLFLLIIAAIVIGFVVFVIASVLQGIVNTFQSLFGSGTTPPTAPDTEGRQNVRIID